MTNCAKTIQLTPSQAEALEHLLFFATDEGTLMTLEGFAGTGKTTLVAHLLQELASDDIKTAVCAPTNKAVGVLQQKLGDTSGGTFGSLHSFLGLRLSEREDGSHQCEAQGMSTLHEYDLVIVDEASMVSAELFAAILSNRRCAKILFVGDPAQLPPVGDGQDSPVFRMVREKCRLNEIVRQALDNPIISASLAVRSAIEGGERISLPMLSLALPETRPAAAGIMTGGTQAAVAAIVSETKAGRECRAIAWRNRTVETINAMVHAALYPQDTTPFSAGEILVAHQEFKSAQVGGTKAMRIFTSEEMTLDAIEPAERMGLHAWKCTLLRDNGARVFGYYPADQDAFNRMISEIWNLYRQEKAEKHYSAAKALSAKAWAYTHAFAPLRHCYAMTAHKSQGSTFDTALVMWDDLAGHRVDFEFNRLVYVAMTRAAQYMALVAA